MNRSCRLAFSIGGLLVALGGVAWATRPMRVVGIDRSHDELTVSANLRDLFREGDAAKLKSGAIAHVRVRLILRRVGEPEPVAQVVWRSQIVYDIWDEVYRVRLSDDAGEFLIAESGRRSEAIEQATTLTRFPVVERAVLVPGARYEIEVRAALNPISEELAAEVRHWLLQPPGGSLFGSVVGLFVNPQIDASERRLQFFSPPFVEPVS